jgi:hypothetical protein
MINNESIAREHEWRREPSNITKDEKIARYRELRKHMVRFYLTENEHEELHQLADDIINMYRKCIDIDEVTDEELAEWDYQ